MSGEELTKLSLPLPGEVRRDHLWVQSFEFGKDSVLPVLLLQAGKPLANALVVAIEKSRPEGSVVRVRTDAHGRARITLASPGVWLLKAVWVTPIAGKTDEWESWWASLTFELPSP